MIRVTYEALEPSADFLLMEYDGVPFTGVAVERKDNTMLIAEESYFEGQKHGLSREWYEGGQLKIEQTFIRGALFGTAREWYPSGCLKKEALYERGICLNKNEFDEKGALTSTFELPSSDPLSVALKDINKRNSP